MLLQLSAKHGLNTDIVASWAVGEGYVIIAFSSGDNVTLNRDEGFVFLKHVEADFSLRFKMKAILLGKGETDEQQVKDTD